MHVYQPVQPPGLQGGKALHGCGCHCPLPDPGGGPLSQRPDPLQQLLQAPAFHLLRFSRCRPGQAPILLYDLGAAAGKQGHDLLPGEIGMSIAG